MRPYTQIARVKVNGKLLTDARIAANMSMEDVAKALGCNKSSVSKWERNKLLPDEGRILQMVMLFNDHKFLVRNEEAREGYRRVVRWVKE